ncbi:MAG: mandelate racemase/muconate lactonizing enzyme family protein [Planctomycetota bacterium]
MITACLHERVLPLKRALPTPQGKVPLRRVLVLVLQDESGNAGYGEAAPLPVFGTEDPVTCREILTELREQLPAIAERWLQRDLPQATLGPLERRLTDSPCARACIEGALLDLWAKRYEHGLADILQRGGELPLLRSLPVYGILIGGGSRLGESASQLVERGCRSLHLTVGSDCDKALAQARTLREAVGPAIALHIDAQGLWDRDRAKSFVVRSRSLDLAVLEQPLPPDDLEGLAALRRQSTVPIAVDESVRQASDVARVAAKEAADIVMLKPSAIGGWRPSLQATELARSLHMHVITASFMDGSIGRALASHIAAALGCSDRDQGLATGGLLEHDLTDAPLRARNGILTFTDEPGLGIGTLLPEISDS